MVGINPQKSIYITTLWRFPKLVDTYQASKSDHLRIEKSHHDGDDLGLRRYPINGTDTGCAIDKHPRVNGLT